MFINQQVILIGGFFNLYGNKDKGFVHKIDITYSCVVTSNSNILETDPLNFISSSTTVDFLTWLSPSMTISATAFSL